jgi:MtN3 and saliva related transmembrane protein
VATLIGSSAAVLTTACWLPQVVKSMRLGTADDFAWPYLAMLVAGVAAWTAYGFLRSAPPIYLRNSITGFFVVGVKVRPVRHRARLAEEVAMLVIDGIES